MEFMRINHVGFRVSDMDASVRFYEEVLGLREVDALPDRSFVALSWGTELHDVALILDSAAAGGQGGVHHVAITLAGGTEELRAFAARAAAGGATIEMTMDHLVTRSVYVLDPDGNRIEVYVDMPKAQWEDVPHAILRGDPLQL
jgi:catechol 2,3-dioxygenase